MTAMRYGLSHHLKTICIVCGFIQCSRQIIFESCLQDTSAQPPYLLSLQIYTTCKTWSSQISFYRILKPCIPSCIVRLETFPHISIIIIIIIIIIMPNYTISPSSLWSECFWSLKFQVSTISYSVNYHWSQCLHN